MAKARSLNKVMLIGNLTRNPVIRETNNGVMVCSFGIATNTNWKDKSGQVKEKAEYHNLIAFNKLAEICAMVLTTGMLVYVEGELRTRVTDGQDGKKFYRTEIKLNDMILIDSKGKKGVGIDEAIEAGRALPPREVSEEDIVAGQRESRHDERAVDDVPADVVEASDEEFKSDELF